MNWRVRCFVFLCREQISSICTVSPTEFPPVFGFELMIISLKSLFFLCAKNLIRNDFKNNLHVVRHFLIDQIKLKLKQRQQKLLIPVPILFPFIDIHWTERYLIKKLSSVSINITYWGRNYQNIFCVIFFYS